MAKQMRDGFFVLTLERHEACVVRDALSEYIRHTNATADEMDAGWSVLKVLAKIKEQEKE